MEPPTATIDSILVCPACRTTLRNRESATECPRCGIVYSDAKGRLDLRPRERLHYTVDFEIGSPLLPEEGFNFGPLVANDKPSIQNWRDIDIDPLLTNGNRLSPELLSYFPRSESGGMMLDLGCGHREFEPVCRHTNLKYVGVDYSGDEPDMLADAHALPFRDNSFDFVLSLAVLEHLRYPHVAMSEAFRVLKPGGAFIGTVAFLEPFHMDSYAHLTHLGTYNVLKSAGFDIDVIAPNVKWSAMHALAHMILYPRIPERVTRALMWPNWMLHKLWWKLGHAVDPKERTSEKYRLPATTGGFRFVTRKPLVAADAPHRASVKSTKHIDRDLSDARLRTLA